MHNLKDEELFQFSILQAADEVSRRQPPPDTALKGHVSFLGYLAYRTVFKNPLAVFVGFVGILNGQSIETCMRLYNELGNHPKHSALQSQKRTLLSIQRTYRHIEDILYKRFMNVFPSSDVTNKFKLHPIYKDVNNVINQFIQLLAPWKSDCLQRTSYDYDSEMNRRAENPYTVELATTRIHCSIHDECLTKIAKWYASQESLSTWHLPFPPNCDSGPTHNNLGKPPDKEEWKDINERIRKNVHWKEQKEREMQSNHQAVFEILVDGELLPDVLTRHKRSTAKILLPSYAGYVEIRVRKTGAAVAHCHLMDPEDLPARGWKGMVRLLSGEKLLFRLSPEPRQDNGELNLTMRVKLRGTLPWLRLDVIDTIWRWVASKRQFTAVRWTYSGLLGVVALAAFWFIFFYQDLPELKARELKAKVLQQEDLSGVAVACGAEWDKIIGEGSETDLVYLIRDDGRNGAIFKLSSIQLCPDGKSAIEDPAIYIPVKEFNNIIRTDEENVYVIISRGEARQNVPELKAKALQQEELSDRAIACGEGWERIIGEGSETDLVYLTRDDGRNGATFKPSDIQPCNDEKSAVGDPVIYIPMEEFNNIIRTDEENVYVIISRGEA